MSSDPQHYGDDPHYGEREISRADWDAMDPKEKSQYRARQMKYALEQAGPQAEMQLVRSENINRLVQHFNRADTNERVRFARQLMKYTDVPFPEADWENANFTYIISPERGHIIDVEVKAMGESRRYQIPAMTVAKEIDGQENDIA